MKRPPVQQFWLHWSGLTFKTQKNKHGEWRVFNAQFNHHKNAFYSDGKLLELFLWLGKYLAYKKRIPSAIQLDQIAVKAKSVEKDIRMLVAEEVRKQMGDNDG